ncbi:MAG TPA: hypothetical protein ENK18_07650 [Deltaproteobacteria bacterium]|nr:hypothetical protein [Deltaproteobacteria bacterium]
MHTEPTGRQAAFFRAEGVLVSRPAHLAAAWLAANAQHLGQRAARLGAVALAAPLSLGLGDSSVGHRVAWSALRGMSADRIAVLGEEYAATQLLDRLRPAGVDLLERSRRDGCTIVLISDLIDEIVAPVGAMLRADHVVCNHLEYRNRRATGRLMDPIATRFGGGTLRAFADDHGLDLSASRAYGAFASDQVLLASVRLPCAVSPDRGLRRIALDLDWPVVER